MKNTICELNKLIFNFIYCLLTILFSAFMIGCAAHTNLTPVGKGNVDASISLGGPFIPVAEIKIPIPVPGSRSQLWINYKHKYRC